MWIKSTFTYNRVRFVSLIIQILFLDIILPGGGLISKKLFEDLLEAIKDDPSQTITAKHIDPVKKYFTPNSVAIELLSHSTAELIKEKLGKQEEAEFVEILSQWFQASIHSSSTGGHFSQNFFCCFCSIPNVETCLIKTIT